jgi:hypothetical protein
MTVNRFCHQLAKAGLWGMVALAVMAIVAGAVWLFLKLPRPVQLLVFLAAFGWGIWSWSWNSAKADLATTERPAPRAELVRLP